MTYNVLSRTLSLYISTTTTTTLAPLFLQFLFPTLLQTLVLSILALCRFFHGFVIFVN